MAEKKFDAQVNYGWGLSLNMTGKAPAVAKRIFNTYADALAYANDVKDSAIEGLVLSVVADGDKNGVYFVQSIKTSGSTKSAVLVKLGSEASASGNLSAAIKALNVTDTAVSGQFVSEVSQKDGKISVKRASLADAKVGEDSEGHAISLTDKLTALNQSIVAEKNAREQAVTDIKGELGDSDATTLAAINDELDAIDAKIGTVPTNKTVVGMISAAESAAKAAATKINEKTSGHVTVSGVQDQTTKAWTYTISENDIASADELQGEINRALGAEASLQGQIGTGFTSGKTVAAAIAANKTAIDAMNADVTSTGGNKVSVQVVETAGKITAVTVAESDIASANALTSETNARTVADTNLQSQIGKAATEEGGPTGLHKEIADAKTDLIGRATTEYNTLGKLEGKIKDAVAAAKSYTINKVTEGLGTNVKEAYKLVDEDGTQSGATINIYNDSSLKEVKLVDQKLQFTYILDNGAESTVDVDVSKFLAESEFANGLQVVDHVVSVKVDSTSDNFLTVSKDGIKLSGVKTAIDGLDGRLDIIEGADTVEGSVNKALKDAKAYTDTKISDLYATVGSQTVASGKHVAVEVVEENGKLKTLTVTESDIAKASELTTLKNSVGTGFTATDTVAKAIDANKTAINTLNADSGTTGSVAKAVADAKTELLGGATTDYNTLGKLENKVKAVDAAAKAAATKISEKTTGHITVSSSKDKTTSALTYTISETDIASAQELGALKTAIGTGFTTGATVTDHIAVLEGVTVTGENAIAVSASSATESKVVSLKLGKQPADKEAGVVLSQDANGLVAKLYWGTF